MLTATGRYISGSLTEQGRFVYSNLSETGEFAPELQQAMSLSIAVKTGFSATAQAIASASLGIAVPVRFQAAYYPPSTAALNIVVPVNFSAAAKSPVPASLAINIPISFSAAAKSPNAAQLDIGIPLSFSATASSPNTARVTIPTLVRFAASGAADRTARVNIVVPVGFSATAYQNATASVALPIKVALVVTAHNTLYIAPADQPGGATPTAGQTWVLNTVTGGHSTYTNYGFNSGFRLGDIYYGCSDNGVFSLDGESDAGVRLDWSVKTGITDFGTFFKKYVHDTRMTMRADGDIALREIVDEQIDRSQAIAYSDERYGIHARRIKLPKGISGTEWQFEISGENVNADIKSFYVTPDVSTRTQ